METMDTEFLSRSERRIREREMRGKYAGARMAGASASEAAIEAGYTAVQATNAMRDIEPKVRRTIAEYLPDAGAGNEKIAQVVADALDATKLTKLGRQDDHYTRIQAARFAAELTGQASKHANVALNINLTLPGEMASRFEAYCDDAPVIDAQP